MRTQIVTEQILGVVLYSNTIQGEAEGIWLHLQLYVCIPWWFNVERSYCGERNSRMVQSEHIPGSTPLQVYMVCDYCVKIDLNRIRNIKVLPRGPFPPALAFNASKAFCSSFCFCLKATSSCRRKQTQTVHTPTPNYFHDIPSVVCVSPVWAYKMLKLLSMCSQSPNLKWHIALEKLFKCFIIVCDKQGTQLASNDITIQIISDINW